MAILDWLGPPSLLAAITRPGSTTWGFFAAATAAAFLACSPPAEISHIYTGICFSFTCAGIVLHLDLFSVCGSAASALLSKELFGRNSCVESIVNGDRASGIGSLSKLIIMIKRGSGWPGSGIAVYLLTCLFVGGCFHALLGSAAPRLKSLLMVLARAIVRFFPNIIALALHPRRPHPVSPASRRVGRRKQGERGYVGRRTVARHAPYTFCYRFVPKTVWAPKPSADGVNPSLGESWAPTVHRPIP